MKKKFYHKKKLLLSIGVCILLVAVTFSGVIAKDIKDKPDWDWDYWTNEPHMFSNVTGNVGIGTTTPTEKLDIDGNIAISGTVDGRDISADGTKLDTVYSWGDHSAVGYLTVESDPVFTGSSAYGINAGDIVNWNAAFGWGDHSLQSYLKTVAVSPWLSGDGTSSSPLDLAQNGASNGQVMKWDDATGAWVPEMEDSGPWSLSTGSSVDDSIVGLWHMDEGSSDTVYDETDNDNDGTIYGAIWTTGKYDDALSFDGVNDYVNIPNSDSLDVSDEITLSAWIKFNVDPYSITQERSYIFDKYYSFRLWYSANGEGNSDEDEFFLDVWDWQGVNTQGITWEQDEWYHLVYTYDGSTARAYVNGVLNNENSFTKTINVNNNAFIIGKGTTDGRFWNGVIDEAAIWNRAISASEVEDLYNYGLYTDGDKECVYYNTGNVGIGTDAPSEKLDVDGNVKITGDLTVDGTITGNIGTIHVSQITGLLGQGYTLMFPDIINNLAPLVIPHISVFYNDVVILHSLGYDIECIPGYDYMGRPNDQPGFAMEHPLIFEVGGDYATALKAWFDGDPPSPEDTCLSITVHNLAGEEAFRIIGCVFAPDGYEPGMDGRTRFTLKHNRLPNEWPYWEINNYDGYPYDPFGNEGSNNLETDLHMEIQDIVNEFFYPVIVDDEVNRTLNLTYDIVEGHGIYDWVIDIVRGIPDKRCGSVIHEDEDGNELWRWNYYEMFPIKYEIIYGYGLNTKIKARVILSYDFSELGN